MKTCHPPNGSSPNALLVFAKSKSLDICLGLYDLELFISNMNGIIHKRCVWWKGELQTQKESSSVWSSLCRWTAVLQSRRPHYSVLSSISRPANTPSVPMMHTAMNTHSRMWSSTMATNFHSSAAWRGRGLGVNNRPCLNTCKPTDSEQHGYTSHLLINASFFC